jgi:hypothetical protein
MLMVYHGIEKTRDLQVIGEVKISFSVNATTGVGHNSARKGREVEVYIGGGPTHVTSTATHCGCSVGLRRVSG